MTISALQGPVLSFGQATSSDSNPDRGPSGFDQGALLLDPRSPFAYNPGGVGKLQGWLGATRCILLDTAPPALATGAVAAAQTVTSGTAMTLVSASGAGIVVGVSVVNASTGATVTGLLAVGAAMGSVAFGQTGIMNAWDPTKALSRALSITGSTSATGGDFLVAGYDLYGYPMTETIAAAAGAVTTDGKKAWKYIASVTPQFTDAHDYSVDTTDIIGFPLRADEWGYAEISMNAAWITASTGFTAADTTSPATATTGDTRGTYALQTASDGTKKLVIWVSPSVANISSATGLTGVTPA